MKEVCSNDESSTEGGGWKEAGRERGGSGRRLDRKGVWLVGIPKLWMCKKLEGQCCMLAVEAVIFRKAAQPGVIYFHWTRRHSAEIELKL